jgi:23S rRNA pseudouridine2605 synthase
MNNKEGNNKKAVLDHLALDLALTSQTLDKRAQGLKKAKINTKVAEAVSDKVENPIKSKETKVKDEIRFNKYIANSGACSRRDADIYIQSGTVK